MCMHGIYTCIYIHIHTHNNVGGVCVNMICWQRLPIRIRACMGAWRGALVFHAENKVKNDEERGGKKHS